MECTRTLRSRSWLALALLALCVPASAFAEFVVYPPAECEVADASPASPTTLASGAKANRSTTSVVRMVCPFSWSSNAPTQRRVWVRSVDRNCDAEIVCTPSEQFLDADGVTRFRLAPAITTIGCGTHAQESGSSPAFATDPINRVMFCSIPVAEGTRVSSIFTYVEWRE